MKNTVAVVLMSDDADTVHMIPCSQCHITSKILHCIRGLLLPRQKLQNKFHNFNKQLFGIEKPTGNFLWTELVTEILRFPPPPEGGKTIPLTAADKTNPHESFPTFCFLQPFCCLNFCTYPLRRLSANHQFNMNKQVKVFAGNRTASLVRCFHNLFIRANHTIQILNISCLSHVKYTICNLVPKRHHRLFSSSKLYTLLSYILQCTTNYTYGILNRQ